MKELLEEIVKEMNNLKNTPRPFGAPNTAPLCFSIVDKIEVNKHMVYVVATREDLPTPMWCTPVSWSTGVDKELAYRTTIIEAVKAFALDTAGSFANAQQKLKEEGKTWPQ